MGYGDAYRTFRYRKNVVFCIDISTFFSIINDTLADVHDYIFKYEDNKSLSIYS